MKHMMKRTFRFVGIAGTGLALAACSSMGVKPWERNILAKPAMEMTADSLDLSFDEHIYFSKEASSGGQGFAGGGCGCN
jgi:hypothetical protein